MDTRSSCLGSRINLTAGCSRKGGRTMKKTMVAALAAALTVGAASTTFAAANPFSDVPRDHWAYDAVTQLAADGVVEGYGDGTFRGDRNITRYEMAQMVARAMAKGDLSASDRALVDRLAAEFADELNNLGVRVSNLERNADMVKWTGYLRYDYFSDRNSTDHTKKNTNRIRFRLFPSAEVNDHWKVNARLDTQFSMKDDNGSNVTLGRAYADGTYGKLNIKLGKQDLYSAADEGMVFDDVISGAKVTFGNVVKASVTAGRMSKFADRDVAGNYQGIELTGTAGKLFAGVGYHHVNSDAFKNTANYSGYSKNNNEDNANIWAVGANYKFDKNVGLKASYAKNSAADKYDTARSFELDYKGAKNSDQGSWGAYVAYRYLGDNVSFAPTYNVLGQGQKGWAVGTSYTIWKNVMAKAEYFKGKEIDGDDKVSKLFGRVQFSF